MRLTERYTEWKKRQQQKKREKKEQDELHENLRDMHTERYF